MEYPWESELQSLTALSDQEAADAINAMTATETPPSPARVPVRMNFADFARILDHGDEEYNTLRGVIEAAVNAGSYLVRDMRDMLATERGIDAGDPKTVVRIAALCAQSAALSGTPAKIAAYVASFQPATPQPITRQKYTMWATAAQVAEARGGLSHG